MTPPPMASMPRCELGGRGPAAGAGLAMGGKVIRAPPFIFP
jgi:hypothetical protein